MERVEDINIRLREHFSVAWNNLPIYRIVWSEDQFEKRFTNYTDSGIALLHPEVRLLPKYKQWIQNKYILERLTVVPEINRSELTEKISYEPIYVFEDKHSNPLPPKWEACKFVIDTLNAAVSGDGSLKVKYVDPMISDPEHVQKRIENLQEELFGNETEVTDALKYREGVMVPSNYKKEN